MDLSRLFDLESHGADTFVGIGPQYPWGGLYGGQIVAQALRAAASTVDSDLEVHSLRSYFIRRGDHTEPIRFEVDRIRNGRSFSTRRVIARQAVGAILNLEASFQRPEPSIDLQTITMDTDVPAPGIADVRFVDAVVRASIRPADVVARRRRRLGAGRTLAWMKVNAALGRRSVAASLLAGVPLRRPAHRRRAGCDRARRSRTGLRPASITRSGSIARFAPMNGTFTTSPATASSAGAAWPIGHVFAADGAHVATVAQEVLMRGHRARPDWRPCLLMHSPNGSTRSLG